MNPLEITDIGLEREIIGLALTSPSALLDLGKLRPEHFLQVQTRAVWRLIQKMSASGHAITTQTVAARVHEIPEEERRGVTPVWLFDCQASAPIPAVAETYANQQIDVAGRHNLSLALTRCQQIASGGGSALELTELVRSEIDATIPEGTTGHFLAETLGETIKSFSFESPVVPTPWARLNQIIGGWRPGALYVVGARPGAGKTIMGLQAALDLAKSGPVAFNSLEMGQSELHQRALAHATGVQLSRLKGKVNGQMSLVGDDYQRVVDAQDTLEQLPLSIDDRSYVTTTDIRAHARSVSRHGPLAGVVVDYLQLMGTPRGDNRARHEVVAGISRDLKLLAKELQCPVIALSQLNRASETRAGKSPTLADLRESGAIEQDADVVLLLSVPEDDNGKSIDHELRVMVAKNRHGEANKTVRLLRQGWISTLADQQEQPINHYQGGF